MGAPTVLDEEIGDKFTLIDTSVCEVFGDEIGTEVDGLYCREVRFFKDFFFGVRFFEGFFFGVDFLFLEDVFMGKKSSSLSFFFARS